jgi:hypothetical protein
MLDQGHAPHFVTQYSTSIFTSKNHIIMCNNCNAKNEAPKADCSCSKDLIGMIPFMHTQIMEAVGRHKDFPEIAPEDHYVLVANKTRSLLAQAGYPNAQLPTFSEEFAIISEIQNTEPEQYIALLVERGTVTPQGAKVLEAVWAILNGKMRRKFQVNALEELYGYVNGVQTLPADEKIALLYGLKIGVASVNFFACVASNKNSPYYRVLRAGSTQRRRFPWADIIGGTVNCIGCSAGGFAGCLGCASISSGLASTWFGAQKE